MSNTVLKTITKNYAEIFSTYCQQRDKIQDKVEQRKKQIERLDKRLDNLVYPHWIEFVLKPIAEEIVKKMPGYYYETYGPFGLACETSIHFYKGEDKEDETRFLIFRPGDLDIGEIKLIDRTKNLGRYKQGTIGEANGGNYQTIPMKETIDELIEFMNKEIEINS